MQLQRRRVHDGTNVREALVKANQKGGAWEISVWSLSFLGKWLGASDEQENGYGREAVGGGVGVGVGPRVGQNSTTPRACDSSVPDPN